MKRIILLTVFLLAMLCALASCKHTHDFGDWENIKKASCTEEGVNMRYCSCGESESENIPATGHTEEIDEAFVATCTKEGKSEGKHCSVCDEVLVSQDVFPALGHDFGEIKCNACGEYRPDYSSKGLVYTLSEDGEYYILSGIRSGGDSNVVIAAVYNGLPVKEIGRDAFKNSNMVSSIIIPDSIIHIDEYAFLDCPWLDYNMYKGARYLGNISNPYLYLARASNDADFTIPEGTRFIGIKAFDNCGKIINLTIPDSVTHIGEEAFAGGHLKNISIPDSVTYIGNWAFGGCYELANVYIGKSVTHIGTSAFSANYKLLSIDVDENNQCYKTIDGNLYSKDGKSFIAYAAGKTDTHFVIPDSVTKIHDVAFFGCKSLTSITIPNSVTTIGNSAFYNCDSLENIIIPDSVTTIGKLAFYFCDSLENIIIPDSVTTIGKSAFYLCDSLENIIIPDSVTVIDENVFGNCSSLRSVIIPNSVTKIGDGAFSLCNSLMKIIIPDSVTSIGKNVFFGCYFEELYYTGSEEDWATISIDSDNHNLTEAKLHFDVVNADDFLFFTNEGVHYLLGYVGNEPNLVLPDSYNGEKYEIYNRAFYFCSNLNSVVIPDGVTSIGYDAFSQCTSLTSIVIPDSVTFIDEWVFGGCSNIKDIYYTGSEEDWAAISIEWPNHDLTNSYSKIRFNYVPEE